MITRTTRTGSMTIAIVSLALFAGITSASAQTTSSNYYMAPNGSQYSVPNGYSNYNNSGIYYNQSNGSYYNPMTGQLLTDCTDWTYNS